MIYADYNASMPITYDVKKYLINRFNGDFFGNPNALHSIGRNLNKNIEISREFCAEILGANPNNIVFNSGSTEAINNIFYSALNKKKNKKIIIISEIEHEAVIKTASYYQTLGFTLVTIPVIQDGIIDIEYLENIIKEKHSDIALISIMAANNETGVIQPTEHISKLCNQYSILYFCDTCQLIGKAEFDFKKSMFDFACLSGHKIGALPGSGIILIKNPDIFTPLIIGSNQENKLRAGTQNYMGIETLAIALKSFNINKNKILELNNLKLNFENKLKQKFNNLIIFGSNAPRICNTTMVSFPGLHSQAIQIELEAKNIYVTTSSACMDNDPSPSYVLSAMKYGDNVSRGAVRISSSLNFTENDYDIIYSELSKIYLNLAKIKFN